MIMENHNCRICGYCGTAKTITAYEMYMGTKEPFEYFICPSCGCLEIDCIPDNLGDYYNNDSYYSFDKPQIKTYKGTDIHSERVLDVGCGNGFWLCERAAEGYVSLTGCDPFLKDDLFYENGVKIYKKTIHEMDGEYDLILLQDSYEHVTDPHEVLDSVYRLLSTDGTLIMSFPMFPNMAFEMFGENWVQLDAPRHLTLFSEKSLAYLADLHGFDVQGIKYNSNNGMFARSFLYSKGVPLAKQDDEVYAKFFKQDELDEMERNAQIANENHCADHAIVYFKKKTD